MVGPIAAQLLEQVVALSVTDVHETDLERDLSTAREHGGAEAAGFAAELNHPFLHEVEPCCESASRTATRLSQGAPLVTTVTFAAQSSNPMANPAVASLSPMTMTGLSRASNDSRTAPRYRSQR